MRFFATVLSLFVLMVLFHNCTRGPYAATNKQHKKRVKELAAIIRQTPPNDSLSMVVNNWVGTTNFDLRKPNFVVIHHTAQNSCDQTLRTFTLPRTQVSAHYVICKDGTIHHMLNDRLRAWHGGVSKWGNTTDLNSSSIGIEIDNNGVDVFSEAQISSLLQLLANLKKAYTIPVANFIGHSDIAPTRKVDPNVHFPWKKLADAGFGYWWTDTAKVIVPANFNSIQALRIIGYDTKDSTAAIKAFKRKFLQTDGTGKLTEEERKVLYTLYRKYD